MTSIALKRTLHLTRFDWTVFGVIAALVVAIFVTTLAGRASAPGLRVAFVKDDDGVPNIWIADVDNPDDAEQLTSADYGVPDYDVSADGRYLAYAVRDINTDTADIRLLDLRTGQERQITNCLQEDADCTAPVFRPDGAMIAYQRIALNSALGIGAGVYRIWLIDLNANSTYPLFDDSQVIGSSPVWSSDGRKLAFFDGANAGIIVYDFDASEAEGESPIAFIPSMNGATGTLSPDGTKLVFPELIFDQSMARSYLQVADLTTGLFQVLTAPDEMADDTYAAWNPDGRRIAIARRYLDERFTVGPQVYLMDVVDNTLTPLIADPAYAHYFFRWSPDGNELLMQRFPQLTPTGEYNDAGRPQIWTYNMESRELRLIADNAYWPRWVPAAPRT
jgi:Tol biopolymer transport system component